MKTPSKSPYLTEVSRLSNEYKALMVQAKNVRIQNEDVPSRKEAELYKRAVEVAEKLANMSIGDAYLFWSDRQQEASVKFSEISEYALQLARQKNGDDRIPDNGTRGTGPSGSGTNTGKKRTSRNDVPADVVEGWFKDPPTHGFEAVAGMEELIEKLRGCVRDVASSKIRQYLQMETVHSFFLYGPPGCGKTFISQAFAHELMKQGYKYMSLSGGDIHNSLVGESEKYVERAFREAEEQAPCIIFIDEIDGVCRNRSLPNLPAHMMSTTTAFLTGYNSITHSKKSIIFIGATNYPDLVDNAMLDRVELIPLPLPDLKVRAHTFEMQFGNLLHNEPGFDYMDMADQTDNYNQRDIRRLCSNIKELVAKQIQAAYPDDEDAAEEAMKSGAFCLTRDLFMEALRAYHPSKKDDIIRNLDAWNSDRERWGEE